MAAITEIDHDKLVGWNKTDRYFAFDVDGSSSGIIGNAAGSWQKQAIARRHAEGSGYGLYDAREREVVLDVDLAKRRSWLETKVSTLIKEAADAQSKLDLIGDIERGHA